MQRLLRFSMNAHRNDEPRIYAAAERCATFVRRHLSFFALASGQQINFDPARLDSRHFTFYSAVCAGVITIITIIMLISCIFKRSSALWGNRQQHLCIYMRSSHSHQGETAALNLNIRTHTLAPINGNLRGGMKWDGGVFCVFCLNPQ